MLNKKVYLNDQLIGEARTWSEVRALIKRLGIFFFERWGAAEGPSGFYLSGSMLGNLRTDSGTTPSLLNE
jgi:hypothetical protein